ncbi:MAG: histidine kinase [Polyangiales bacterium]
MSELSAVTFGARTLRFLRELWVYLLLAGLLTTLIASVQRLSDATEASALFVGNLWISVLIGASCELGMHATLALPIIARRAPTMRLVLSLPVLLASALLGVEIAHATLRAILPDTAAQFPLGSVRAICVPVTCLMLGLALLRDRTLRERALRETAEREREASTLSALAARTEPHFLFNSLNSIAALTAEDPRAAEQAVLQLAALFRYVLDSSGSREVALADEVGFVRAYLALEQLRYGERLTVRVDVEPASLAVAVPPLVLQPLVENALRHGLSARPQLTVAVHVALADDALAIRVDDDGPGPGGSQHRGTGSSHADLRRRLQIAYGARASLTTSRSALGGFAAVVSLPRSSLAGPDRR